MSTTTAELLFKNAGALIQGHFILASGRHSNQYFAKDLLYPDTEIIEQLCHMMADHFRNTDVEVVVGPEKGAIILETWTASHLTRLTGRKVLGVYAEKTDYDSGFVIKRGYNKIVEGKKVLIVEDVLTTGGSVKKVVEAVRQQDGEVIGVAVLCNRGAVTPEMLGNVPKVFALAELNLPSYAADECPLCRKEEVPINTDFGQGASFLARQAA